MVDFAKPQRLGQMLGWGDNPFYKTFDANRNAVIQGFAGMGTDPMNPGGGFAKGFANGSMLDSQMALDAQAQAEEQQAKNQTIEWLRSKGYGDLVQGVESGALDIGTAFTEGLRMSQPGPSPDPFTLGEGQVRYDGYGNVIAQGPEAGPGTIINNNMGATDAFYDALDKDLAAQTGDLINAGMNAQSNNIRLGQLETVLKTAPQGAQGAMVQAAGQFGINVQGLDDVQAATALINQMVPAQRPPGSGPMSDRDLELFKQSLPAIVNQPGGNQKIIATMRAINEYTVAQAEIAQAVANREITPAQGRELQARVPNPLSSAPGAGAGGDAPTAVNPQTGQKVRWDGSNWVPFT